MGITGEGWISRILLLRGKTPELGVETPPPAPARLCLATCESSRGSLTMASTDSLPLDTEGPHTWAFILFFKLRLSFQIESEINSFAN